MIIGIIIANILMLGVYIFFSSNLPPQIPLFYSLPWGEEQLADLWVIFVLPFLMHLFIIVNHFIYKFMFKKDELVLKILNFANWFYIIIFTAIFIRIIFLIS
jgi:hypothetical protein